MSMPPSMGGDAASDDAYSKNRRSPYNHHSTPTQLPSGRGDESGHSKKARHHSPHPETAYMPPPPRNNSTSPTPPGVRRYHTSNHFPGAYRNHSSPYFSMPPSEAMKGEELVYPPPHFSERVLPYPQQRFNTSPFPYYSSYRGHSHLHHPSYYHHHIPSRNVSTQKRSIGETATTPPRNTLDPRFSCSPSTSHESGKTSCETNTTCSSSDSVVASPKQFQYHEQPPHSMEPFHQYSYPSMTDQHRFMSYGTIPPPGMEPSQMYSPFYYSSMPYYPPQPYDVHPSIDNNYLYSTKPCQSTSLLPKHSKHPQYKPIQSNQYTSHTPIISASNNSIQTTSNVHQTSARTNGSSPTPDTTTTYSRKDRALGLLCERFLEKCCYREDKDWISIDEAARTLSVEKRRIYDIINILEAIHIVSRKCKDTYFWHGTTNLPVTFAKLQQHALSIWKEDGIKNGLIPSTDNAKKISDDKICDKEKTADKAVSDVESKNKETCGIRMLLESAKATTDSKNGDENTENLIPPKEKSLAKLCRCFIQLFLVGNDVISLNDACEKILQAHGDTDSSKKKEVSVKTKVRRLYDVANVMVSLRIVVKVGNDKNGNPKNSRPIFKWIYNMNPKDMQKNFHNDKLKPESTCPKSEKQA